MHSGWCWRPPPSPPRPAVLLPAVPAWTVAVAWGFGCFGMGLVISSTSVLLLKLSAPAGGGRQLGRPADLATGCPTSCCWPWAAPPSPRWAAVAVAHATVGAAADGARIPAAFAAVFLPMAAVALVGAWVATRLHEQHP